MYTRNCRVKESIEKSLRYTKNTDFLSFVYTYPLCGSICRRFLFRGKKKDLWRTQLQLICGKPITEGSVKKLVITEEDEGFSETRTPVSERTTKTTTGDRGKNGFALLENLLNFENSAA